MDKKFVFTVMYSCLGFILSLMAMNYIVDPVDIFDSGFFRMRAPNDRFRTILELKKHPEVDSAILGSSRVAALMPSALEKYLPDYKFYNFNISNGTPRDYAKFFDYMLKRPNKLKCVYLELDSINIRYIFNDIDLDKRHHPEVQLEESLFEFYLRALVSFMPERTYKKITDKSKGHELVLERGGRLDMTVFNKQKQDPKKYSAEEPSFHNPKERHFRGTSIKESVSYVRKIKEVCDKNGIKLIVTFYPNNANFLDAIVMEDFAEYLKGIAQITDFYYFGGYNSVACNDEYYVEESHCIPQVDDMMLKFIFDKDKKGLPADFGVYVTKDNVGKIAEDLIKSGKERDAFNAERFK